MLGRMHLFCNILREKTQKCLFYENVEDDDIRLKIDGLCNNIKSLDYVYRASNTNEINQADLLMKLNENYQSI